MKNIKAISEESFNTIKDVASKLKKEVVYEKAHGIDPSTIMDFVDYKAVDGVNLAYELDNFGSDALIAANLEFTNTKRGILINYSSDDDVADDGGLVVESLLDVMTKLVKLGRNGIAKRENNAFKVNNHIRVLENSLDLD